jgi:hypothetical protein
LDESTEPGENVANPDSARLTTAGATWKSWAIVAIALAVYAALRVSLGPFEQDPVYHLFADTRLCLGIPRAGDVLTNLSIMAAGLAGVVLWPRAKLLAEERPAYAVLVTAMIATALGSAYYHWLPSDARLIWDRLPMALFLGALLALVMSDRVDPAFARAGLIPFCILAAGSVLWWWASGDLWLYLVVRIGAGAMMAMMILLRKGRYTGAWWLLGALALDLTMTAAERYDYELYAATGELLSGHNIKHLLAGGVLGCVLAWMVRRRTVPVKTSR